MSNHIKTLTALLAVVVLAMTASSAFAAAGDDPYRSGGENVAGLVQGGGNGGTEGTVAADNGGSLPFTGLDVALILAVGGVLLAVGLGTRRLTRQADTA